MSQPEPTGDIDIETIQAVAERLQDSSLQPLRPDAGLNQYLLNKESEYAPNTLSTHESRLGWFVEYCQNNSIENLNSITGRTIHSYRLWRRNEGDLCTVSEKHSQDTLRCFIDFLESIDAVQSGLTEKVISPSLSQGEDVRDSLIEEGRLEEILDYLSKYRYASGEHVIWSLFGRTGMRLGTLRALDISDFYPGAATPHLNVRHRPEETPLKNQYMGERTVASPPPCSTVLDDYLEHHHPKIKDEFGRMPLIGTKHGRIADSTVRRWVYKWTRPCAISGDCPHGRDINQCAAADNSHQASKCPSAESPHTVRRTYLTRELERGVPAPILADRADLTVAVLDEYYDQRSEEKKMAQRKEIIDSAHQEDSTTEP
jgi:integrase